MGSVLDRLEEREARARVLVERLRVEAERVAGALAAADESLLRLVIARETVAEVLDSDVEQSSDAGGARGVGRDVALYERITRIFAEAGGALRPRQVCEALGMSTEARFIEAMRPKLSRLVADGVLAQVGPGLFAPVAAQAR
jgi:hypothetical protein